MRFAVTLVSLCNYPHTEATREVAESIYYGLVSLGHDTILTALIDCPGTRHIVLCPHLLLDVSTPLAPGSILYNLEQIAPGAAGLHPRLLDLFRQYPVWDYSRRNIDELSRLGIRNVRDLPIGYVPQLSRIPSDEEDFDVVFYGSLNDRRQEILSAMRMRGVKAEVAFSVDGIQRERLIARAKIVLNMHYYESKVFEVVRVSYPLANGRFVVSERGCDPAEEAEFAEGVVFADYGDLVNVCVAYLARSDERQRIARAGFERMVRRDMREYLRAVLDEE